MDDLTAMNPAKLKRRKRTGTSAASVVDLPAAADVPSDALPGGDLLGAGLFGDSHAGALLSLGAADRGGNLPDGGDGAEAEIGEIRALTENDAAAESRASSEAARTDGRCGLSLADLKPESHPEHVSPLDALFDEDSDDRRNSNGSLQRIARETAKNDNRGDDSSAQNDPGGDAAESDCLNSRGGGATQNPLQNSIRSLAAQKARRKHAPIPAADDAAQSLPPKLEEILAQTREVQTRCIDTLTQLRHANALNERRCALWLALGFALLVVVAAIGIFFGISKQNNAKFQELRFKREVYANVVNEKNILAAEYEKEKQGAAAAYEILKHIENGRLEEAVEAFGNTADRVTHPAERALLARRIGEIRRELAENAFNSGVMLYNAQNFEQARDAFFKSLSLEESTAYASRLFCYLAMSLFQLSDYEGASRFFARIQPGELNSEMDANARFYRAVAAEKSGNDAEAYEQFDQFIKKYRYHKLSDEAAKRRAKLDPPKR